MRRRNRSRPTVAEILEIRSYPAASPFALLNGDLIITGTARSDKITVTENGDQIIAKLGRHQESFDRELIGHVEIYSLQGNDTIIVSTERGAIIDSGPGNDKVTCTAETRGSISGGSGNDRLQGGNVGNDMFGDAGNDTLIGGMGDDIMYGDAGRNLLLGGDGEDTLYGGRDNDRIFGENGRDFILDVLGTNLLDGGNDNDVITALSPKNTILGGAGEDELRIYIPTHGIIDGGPGEDVLYSSISNQAGNALIDPRLLQGRYLIFSNIEQGIYPI